MISYQKRFSRLDALKLIVVLGLAFYIGYSPHLDYTYPLHGDEWVHWAHSEAMLQATSTTYSDPFTGESTIGSVPSMETGFHLFLGISRLIIDISWLDVFRFFPSLIFMITVLMIYVFAEREGFGFEAAFFTCLIPTSVGILGPTLLVPVAMGLLFIPLAFYVAFNYTSWSSYLILCLITLFLLTIHPPSAVILFTILIPFILLNIRHNVWHSVRVGLALAIPFAVSLAWIFDQFVDELGALVVSRPYEASVSIPSIVQTFGYMPIAFSFLGTVVLLIKGGRKNYGLVFGLFALTVLLIVFIRLHYGVPILYERGLMYLMLMLAILAGAGLAWIKTIKLPIRSHSTTKYFVIRHVGGILSLIVICVVLAVGIPSRQQAYYNEFIDDEDYQAFIWIRDNLDDYYQKAILDPWKATAFSAITQKSVFTRIHASVKASDEEVYRLLKDGCVDIEFLRENGISIVYGQCNKDNPDLFEIRKNVHVLREIEDQ